MTICSDVKKVSTKGESMNPQLLREIDNLHANLCEALADPKRIAILYALREDATTVNHLAEMLETSQATVSRHLKILRERHLVWWRRDGMNVYYSLSNHRVLQALDLLREVLNEDLAYGAKLAQVIGE